jgi:hypothetical protein
MLNRLTIGRYKLITLVLIFILSTSTEYQRAPHFVNDVTCHLHVQILLIFKVSDGVADLLELFSSNLARNHQVVIKSLMSVQNAAL